MRLFNWRTGIALLGVLGVMMGCNGDIKDYCENLAACEGKTSYDRDACEEALKGERKIADEYGCRDEFDDYYACFVDYGICASNGGSDGNEYTYGNDETGMPACSEEEYDYNGCGDIESLLY